ncbi:hypothetical protein AB1K83_14445 [Sporosarcina sp. 179-K 3D1 HS]|uniref:hypothetical protein n=1 Tax=Sporosarcina sp. 179-K 3D1 HS TaxID=3232169 RepID=UPI0039A21728
MRPLIFWVALGLIGLSWIANSFYAHAQKLNEPIFLEQYTKVEATEGMPALVFYYLTNKDDRSSASAVNIGGVGAHVNGTHFSDEQDRSDLNMQTFTHHALRKMEVELPDYVLDQLIKDGTCTFTKMTVYFSTGGQMEAPIGAIILQEPGEETEPLLHMSSGINSEWRDDQFQAAEPLVIEKFEIIPFVEGETMIKVDRNVPSQSSAFEWEQLPGVNVQHLELPLSMEAGDNLYVYAKRLNGYMEPLLSISGTTDSGEEFHTGMYSSFAPQPYLTQEQVDQIIQEKSKKEAPAS